MQKPFICLFLVSTLTLTSAYSARPQYYDQEQNEAKKSYKPLAASTNSNDKSTTLLADASEKEAQILRNNMEMDVDGSYHYNFETDNGIKRTEQGAVDGTIQGSSSYISPEGVEIKTTYVADETGYHPVGDHIPKIPDYILRALEYIRTHPYIEMDYYTGKVKEKTVNKQ